MSSPVNTPGLFESMVEALFVERAASQIMYHGTRGRNLKSITTNGLQPNFGVKSWSSDNDTSWSQPSRNTHGGVYLTNNIMTAVAATRFGGLGSQEDRIIVVCEIQPRTLLADEDDFHYYVNNLDASNVSANSWVVFHLYISGMGLGNSSIEQRYIADYKAYRDSWVSKTADQLFYGLRNKPHPAFRTRIERLLTDGFLSVLKRLMPYSASEDKWGLFNAKDERKADFQVPTKAEGEAAFREFTEKLTRTLKIYAQSEKRTSSFNVSGRKMEPIKFKGRNRIVAIFRFYTNADDKTVVEPLYGTVPTKTISDWKNAMGPWRTVT